MFISPSPGLQDLIKEGDPKVMFLLMHEQGREKTFKSWPHKTPGKHCLAFAGFYAINNDDITQCAYCHGVIKGWKKDEDPLQVHRAFFPHCPLASGRPILNIGSSDTIYCCPLHRDSMRLHNRRLLLQNNSSGYGTYILALLMVLSAIGITPAIPQLVTKDILTPVTTWKGLIGTKQQEMLLPTKLSSYYWTLDLRTCREAEAKLKAAVTAHKVGLSATVTGMEAELKNSAISLYEFLQSKLNVDFSKQLTKDLKAINISAMPTSTCAGPSTSFFDSSACNLLKLSGTVLETGFLASTDPKTLAGGTGAILERVNSFQDYLSRIRQLWRQAKIGPLPAEYDGLLDSPCDALTSECGSSLTAQDKTKMRTLTRLVEVNKALSDEMIVILHFTTPCINEKKQLAKYRLYALPYAENGQLKQLQLPNNEVWLQKGAEEELNFTTLSCTEYDHSVKNAPLCVATEGLDNNKNNWISGSTSALAITSHEHDGTPQLTVIDTPNNQFLLYSPNKTKGTYECIGKTSQEIEIQDLATFTPQMGCALHLPGKKPLQYEAVEKTTSGSFPVKLIIEQGTLLAKAAAKELSRFPMSQGYARVIAHIAVYWAYYTSGTGAALLITILGGICASLSRRRKRFVNALQLAQIEEQTYVVERSAHP
jgi:hypothetical protein